MLLELIRTFGVAQVTRTDTNGITNQSLAATPKYTDQGGTQAADQNAEYIVVGVELSASADATLQLLDASGGTAKGRKFNVAAKTSSPLIETWIPMGAGKAIFVTTVITGDLSFTIHYIRKNRSNAKQS